MESSECESADDTGPEQLATAHCTSAQQSGGGSAPATVKADRLAADCLQKKRHRPEETTKEHAARLQSYLPFCARCSRQACATAALACVRCRHTYIYIYIYIYMCINLYIHSKISNRMQSLTSLTLAVAWQLAHCMRQRTYSIFPFFFRQERWTRKLSHKGFTHLRHLYVAVRRWSFTKCPKTPAEDLSVG